MPGRSSPRRTEGAVRIVTRNQTRIFQYRRFSESETGDDVELIAAERVVAQRIRQLRPKTVTDSPLCSTP